jgi:exonuclease SbcD
VKLAHLSDSHFDAHSRLADIVEVHRAFLQQAAEAEVNLIVHAGDFFERRSTSEERNALADFLVAASQIAPVFGVKGNHDQAGDLDLFSRLETECNVRIVDRPSAMPGSATVWGGGGRYYVGLLALPWFDKAHLVSRLDAAVDAEATRQATIGAARSLLTAMAAEARRVRAEGAIPILVSHCLVAGSEVSTGQTLIGTTVEMAPQDLLEVGAEYVALGHVHKAQEWFGGRVAYSGSPHRCNYGEPEAKGWRLVTFDSDGDLVSNEFRELPARRVVLLEQDWTGGVDTERLSTGRIPGLGELRVSGDLVRFRYRVRPEDLHLVDGAVLQDILLSAGAHDVKIEAVVEAETRTRAPEITTRTSVADKVEAYLDAKKVEADRPRLRAKVEDIEQ